MTAALSGLRVVDFGQYLAGPLAALLLADQGADTTRIERPGGPAWPTPANTMLHRGRRTVRLDLKDPGQQREAVTLLDQADVVIENFRPGVMDRLGLGPESACARNPRLVYCSIPGFGRTDPRAAWPGWEGTVMAAAGGYAASSELVEGEWMPAAGPAFTPLLLASVFAGTQAAAGIMAALLARERDGVGQVVEVPLYDSFFEAIGVRALRYERNAPTGAMFGAGFYRCRDGGYVSLVTVWYRHLEWFLDAVGHRAWMTEGTASFDGLRSDPGKRAELKRRLVELFATRPAAEWERIGQSAGTPIAALRTSSEWLAEEQARSSGSVVDTADPQAGELTVPGVAVRIRDAGAAEPGPAAPASADGGHALDGLRVLDMTRVVAAPSATRVLAELGADVVKADLPAGQSQSGLPEPLFHEAVNRGKRLTAVDLAGAHGPNQLAELLRWADLLVTNFTLPALQRMGLDERSARTLAPGLNYVYLNTFGTDGPWKDLRGYAEIANTTTGITARTIGAGPPSGVAPTVDLPRTPFTDYAAGLLGAFAAMLAEYRRQRSGRSSSVEIALVTAAAYAQLPYIVGPAGAPNPNDVWTEPGWSAFQHVYRVSDDWLFVGIGADRSGRLLDALGLAAGTSNDARVTGEIAGRLETMTAAEVTELIQAAGGSTHRIESIDRLFEPGGAAERRGIRLEQESAEFGRVVQPGPTMRLSRTPMVAGALPPTWQ
jgi:crotonobetainyl-CoA:carnitine CoA-transferase CaiB-like acyl-CoA transferase